MEWDESQNSSTGLCSNKVTLWTSISKVLLEFLVETGSLQLVEMECHTSMQLQKSKMLLQIMKQFLKIMHLYQLLIFFTYQLKMLDTLKLQCWQQLLTFSLSLCRKICQ